MLSRYPPTMGINDPCRNVKQIKRSLDPDEQRNWKNKLTKVKTKVEMDGKKKIAHLQWASLLPSGSSCVLQLGGWEEFSGRQLLNRKREKWKHWAQLFWQLATCIRKKECFLSPPIVSKHFQLFFMGEKEQQWGFLLLISIFWLDTLLYSYDCD